MRNIGNFAMLTMLAIASFVAASTGAYAQPCTCTIVDGCKEIVFYDEFGNVISTEVICPSTGSGDFNCPQELPPTGPLNLSIAPIAINSTSFSPTFGPIETRLDPARISSNAIIKSLTNVRFPLYVQFSFYARVWIGGIEYCSTTELIFRSTNVSSFRPFNRERFCLVNDVKFVRCDGGAGFTFVLKAGSTCITLG